MLDSKSGQVGSIPTLRTEAIAQLVERLVVVQKVEGSNPSSLPMLARSNFLSLKLPQEF